MASKEDEQKRLCCKDERGFNYAPEICELAHAMDKMSHIEKCTALAKLADEQHSTGIKNGRVGFRPISDIQAAIGAVEVRPQEGPKRNGIEQGLRRARNRLRTEIRRALNLKEKETK